jgi:oxygen-independent coproporphyrinogen III oxidase
MELTSVYLHIPFCRHRCAYCDFNTYAGQESKIPAYVLALCDEIIQVTGKIQEKLPVHTIFFGGGTPSLLSVEQVTQILDTLKQVFEFTSDIEISLEANPGTTSKEYLSALRSIGINRLSMGMQSAQPEELKLIQREHDFPDVIRSVEWARLAGFENINLDLLFAIPGQSLDSWRFSLERALELNIEHLSLYSLTVEEGTPLAQWVNRGLLKQTDDDLAADMMEIASERLRIANFEQYEISNWALNNDNGKNYQCRHNLQYWRNQPYFGFGAGAHGCIEGYRIANARGIREYIRIVEDEKENKKPFPFSPSTVDISELNQTISMQETMMVGLRLTQEGVSRDRFLQTFNLDMVEVFGKAIEKLTSQGLLEWNNSTHNLRLTPRGRYLGNRVFLEFVGDDAR